WRRRHKRRHARVGAGDGRHSVWCSLLAGHVAYVRGRVVRLATLATHHRLACLNDRTGSFRIDTGTTRTGDCPSPHGCHYLAPRRGEDDTHRKAFAVRWRHSSRGISQGATRNTPCYVRLDET